MTIEEGTVEEWTEGKKGSELKREDERGEGESREVGKG